MFNRPLRSWTRATALLVLALLTATCALSQQQKLPDAPSPQNNAPAPAAPGSSPSDQESSSSANPQNPPETRPEHPNPQAPPPGSQEIKTVPPGSVSDNSQSGHDQLFTLQKSVSFVTVPVTVKDGDGKMQDGLLAKDFSVYENGIKQKLTLFTSDPFPLSAALIIDQGMNDLQLRKVNQTFSALGGSFGPFDEAAVFTYGNTVNKRQDFGNSTRMELALQRIRDQRGQNPGPPVVGGPFGSGPMTNGKPVDPGNLHVQTPAKESSVLNDAILMAAQELAHRPRANRKIIFIISDGREYGSRASYAQVLKVLLTDEISVYAIGVDSSNIPVYNKVEKVRIPGFGYSDILPRYANATGGDVMNEFTKDSIEKAYQQITLQARNQYTLGYNTAQTPSSTFREIEVRVKRPGLLVTAKHGYYPLPPQRTEATPPAESSPQPAPPQ